jgi:hypothetical protein
MVLFWFLSATFIFHCFILCYKGYFCRVYACFVSFCCLGIVTWGERKWRYPVKRLDAVQSWDIYVIDVSSYAFFVYMVSNCELLLPYERIQRWLIFSAKVPENTFLSLLRSSAPGVRFSFTSLVPSALLLRLAWPTCGRRNVPVLHFLHYLSHLLSQ